MRRTGIILLVINLSCYFILGITSLTISIPATLESCHDITGKSSSPVNVNDKTGNNEPPIMYLRDWLLDVGAISVLCTTLFICMILALRDSRVDDDDRGSNNNKCCNSLAMIFYAVSVSITTVFVFILGGFVLWRDSGGCYFVQYNVWAASVAAYIILLVLVVVTFSHISLLSNAPRINEVIN